MQSAPVFDDHSGGKQSPKPEAAISPCGQNERPVWCDRRGERRDARGSIKNGTAGEAGLMEASNRRAGDHRRGFQDDITTAFYFPRSRPRLCSGAAVLGAAPDARLFLRRVSTLGMQHQGRQIGAWRLSDLWRLALPQDRQGKPLLFEYRDSTRQSSRFG
jgi:hypothetical protein